jgi:predicted nucleic acid-binding Zn ribbon protein
MSTNTIVHPYQWRCQMCGKDSGDAIFCSERCTEHAKAQALQNIASILETIVNLMRNR